MKKTKAQKGITLIALIITIVVLLILAVVAIRAVQGDGIIQHAKNAASKYTEAQAKEQILLGIQAYRLAHNGDFDVYDFVSNVGSYVDGATGSGTVVTLDGYEFNINADGTITANDVYGGILNGGTIEEYATANGYEGLGLSLIGDSPDEEGNWPVGFITSALTLGNQLVYTGKGPKVIIPTTIKDESGNDIDVTRVGSITFVYPEEIEEIIIENGCDFQYLIFGNFNESDPWKTDMCCSNLKRAILPDSQKISGGVFARM